MLLKSLRRVQDKARIGAQPRTKLTIAGEKAECTRQYMSILSRFLTQYCAPQEVPLGYAA